MAIKIVATRGDSWPARLSSSVRVEYFRIAGGGIAKKSSRTIIEIVFSRYAMTMTENVVA